MVVFPSRKVVVPKKTKRLSDYTEGDIVYIPEGALMAAFYVAKHNYESNLNGTGRTLLVRKNSYPNIMLWYESTTAINKYADNTVDIWLNGDYRSLLNEDIQQAIGTTTFYYTPGNKNMTVTTLERAIFTLSVTELGLVDDNANIEGAALNIASSLQIAYHNGTAVGQFTRSPNTSNTKNIWLVNPSGVLKSVSSHSSYRPRPIFTLPDTTKFYYDTDEFKEVS